MTITLIEYSVLQSASEFPELHIDLLENPEHKKEVDAAMNLVDKGYLKNLGGISQEEYSFKITEKGKEALDGERLRA